MVGLNGCAGRIPAPVLPEDIPAQWAGQETAPILPITNGLLDLVPDPVIGELVQEALDNNPDLKVTALRLKASRLLLTDTRARRWPSIEAGLSKTHDNRKIDPYSGRRSSHRSHQAGFDITWELDIWGRLAAEHAAARSNHQARAETYQSARDALGARVVQIWCTAVGSRQALQAEEDRLANLQAIEATLIRRYEQGLGSLDELSTARARTRVALSDLSARRDDHQRQLRRMEVLLGRYPQARWTAATRLPVIESPPAAVPVRVLASRPDVRAALNRLDAAGQAAIAAQKALLPEIRLSARAFRIGSSPGDLSGATTLWQIVGGLTQPLFQGGRLRDAAAARHLDARAAVAELHRTILTAVNEVEDRFGREYHLALQENTLNAAMSDAAQSRRYFERRYRAGLDTILNLLIAREQETGITLRLIDVRVSRLSNRIDLALAMGMHAPAQDTHQEVTAHE